MINQVTLRFCRVTRFGKGHSKNKKTERQQWNWQPWSSSPSSSSSATWWPGKEFRVLQENGDSLVSDGCCKQLTHLARRIFSCVWLKVFQVYYSAHCSDSWCALSLKMHHQAPCHTSHADRPATDITLTEYPDLIFSTVSFTLVYHFHTTVWPINQTIPAHRFGGHGRSGQRSFRQPTRQLWRRIWAREELDEARLRRGR